MIITSYGLIVFQLILFIGVIAPKSSEAVSESKRAHMLGFSFAPRILRRSEVSI